MIKNNRILLFVIILLWTQHVPLARGQAYDPFQDIQKIEWSRDGSHLVIVTQADLTVYDSSFKVISSQIFPTFPDFGVHAPLVALSPNGEQLYFAGIRRGLLYTVGIRPLDAYCEVNFSALACSIQGILDTTTLQTLVNLDDIEVSPYTAVWSHDGRSIAFRRDDGRATVIYSAVDGTLLKSFSSQSVVWRAAYEGGVEWSPDNRYFARVAGSSGFLFIMDAATGQIIFEYQFENENIQDIIWSPDSTQMLLKTTGEVTSSGFQYDWMLIEIATGSTIPMVNFQNITPFSWDWSPDGTQFAARSADNRIHIWDIKTGELISSSPSFPFQIMYVAYSPNSGRLMVGLNPIFPYEVKPSDYEATAAHYQSSSALDGVIQLIVPLATFDRFSEIAAACGAPSGLTDSTITTEAQMLITQLDALADDAIPASCEADLRAIAQAIM